MLMFSWLQASNYCDYMHADFITFFFPKWSWQCEMSLAFYLLYNLLVFMLSVTAC